MALNNDFGVRPVNREGMGKFGAFFVAASLVFGVASAAIIEPPEATTQNSKPTTAKAHDSQPDETAAPRETLASFDIGSPK